MSRHLFGGRVRTSTVLIALVFVVTLATYLLVRPGPDHMGHGATSTPQPASSRPTRPSPTARPRHRPSPTPSPTVTSLPSASETPRSHTVSPSTPVPSQSPAVPSQTSSPSAGSSQ